MRSTVKILNVKIDPLTTDQVLDRVSNFLKLKKVSLISTVNSEFIMKAQKDDDFFDILNNKSALNTADGIGVLWAAKFLSLKPKFKNPFLSNLDFFLQWLGLICLIPIKTSYFKNPIPERISGSDFIWDLAKYCANNNIKLFLLGGEPTIAERTALELQTKINDLKIAGVHSGGNPREKSLQDEVTKDIINAINKSKADIVLVAFGSPKQEKWIIENLPQTTAKIGIGVGGTFDFISGQKKRAPLWMQKIGLEWLYRLLIEPKRIWRQLAIPRLMWLTLKEKIKNENQVNTKIA